MPQTKHQALIILLHMLISYGFMGCSDGQTCPEGQRVLTGSPTGCSECPDHQYQPEPNLSQQCQVCTRCNLRSGSMLKVKCSRTHDGVCQCRPGFTPQEKDSSRCKCDRGSGITGKDDKAQCFKCEDGFFTDKINSACIKWKECKMSGVKVNGTKTSDNVCNDEKEMTSATALHPTSNPRNKQNHSRRIPQLQTSIFPTAPMLSTKDKGPYDSGMSGFIVCATVGVSIILILAAVTCKLVMIPHILNHWTPAQDSVCQKSVQEIGDKEREKWIPEVV